jgi:hypothetical protein
MADKELPFVKATSADVTASILFTLPADMAIGGSDHAWDDAGNFFVAWGTSPAINSNNQWIEVRKYTPPVNFAQPPAWSTRVFPPANHKYTGNPTLGHRGTMLTVECSAYVWPTNLPRIAALVCADAGPVYVVGSAPPPPPPPPATADLVISAPASMAGTWRRVTSFQLALENMDMEELDNGNPHRDL